MEPVMVWTLIGLNRRTEIVVTDDQWNDHSYVDEMITIHTVPMADDIGPDFILALDNPQSHPALLSANFLKDHEIQILDWLSSRFDLNSIYIIDRWIRARNDIPNILRNEHNKRYRVLIQIREGHTCY